MTGLWAYTVLVLLVGLERLAELRVSQRNTAWSLKRGGRETGQGHYPAMVVLHIGLLVGALAESWLRRPQVPAPGGALAVGQVVSGVRQRCHDLEGYRIGLQATTLRLAP